MTLPTPETHLEYVQRIGAPRDVRCRIDLGYPGSFVWVCKAHDYGFNAIPEALDRFRLVNVQRNLDRCPMSRLEAWRARRWAVTA